MTQADTLDVLSANAKAFNKKRVIICMSFVCVLSTRLSPTRSGHSSVLVPAASWCRVRA